MNSATEQFEVLSNALRIYPERIMQLGYYINDAKDPEEGVANIESAFRDVLNQFYGMMCTLKDNNFIASLYEDIAITSLLCLRHVVQHLSGKVRNLFRDSILNRNINKAYQIEYSASDMDRGRCAFPINVIWYENGIKSSNYSSKWQKISTFWNLDSIKQYAEKQSITWDFVYIDATSLITDAVCHLCLEYGKYFSTSGFDSEVYYEHFNTIKTFDKFDFALVS